MCNKCNHDKCCCPSSLQGKAITISHPGQRPNNCEDVIEKIKDILGIEDRICELKFGPPIINGSSVTLIAQDGEGTMEYSSDGVIFQDSPTLLSQSNGTRKYYIREKEETTCIASGYITIVNGVPCTPNWQNVNPVLTECRNDDLNYYQADGCGNYRWIESGIPCTEECEPFWQDLVPEQTMCIDEVVNVRQWDGCGNFRWSQRDDSCPAECFPSWRNYEPLVTQCIDGKINNYQWDGCQYSRWNPTDVNCGLVPCNPNWQNVTPEQTDCIGGKVNYYQADGCGGFRWNPTNTSCGSCVPNWVNVSPEQTQCISGKLNFYQQDGCGHNRWNATNTNCAECTPVWVNVSPLVTDCLGGFINNRQQDGCGNFRWNPTNVSCIICDRGPFIAPSSLVYSLGRIDFLFDAANVLSFKWRIKDDEGNVIRNGVQPMVNMGVPIFSPGNRPFITFSPLTPGDYTFEIEGDSCESEIDSDEFNVPDEGGGGEPGSDAGRRVVTVGNRTISYIENMEFRVQVNPTTGAVRLVYPDSKPSLNGTKTVYPWLFHGVYAVVRNSEINQLRSGVVLPDGVYHFSIYYISDMVTYEDQIIPLVHFWAGYEGRQSNSNKPQYVTVEVKTN